MAGVINRPVAAKGIIAFQDRENPVKFEYFPSSGQAVLGDTLESFDCSYYGIGGTPQWVQTGPMKYLDLAGGVVSGKVRFDATEEQLKAITDEIGRIYEIDDPELVPVILQETKAQPVFAQGVAGLGGNSKYSFPEQVNVGSSLNFNIDSGNSLFPQLIAGLNRSGDEAQSAPTVGMNISGKLQLYGEPFEARLRADLKQVWEYVRDQVDVGAQLGWFNLSSRFDKIAQDLQRESIIQMEFIQGRADSTFGLQLLESTKVVFEAINAKITSGEGMFRFEPNPTPQEPKDPDKSWFASLAPWSVGLNMSFVRNSFKQSITFDQRVRFQGIFTIPVTSSFNLGVVCSSSTQNMFHDVTLGKNGCITPEKVKALQTRISKEVAAKNTRIEDYTQRLLDGKITLQTFETLVAMLNTIMLTEQGPQDTRSVEEMVQEIENRAFRIASGRRGPVAWRTPERRRTDETQAGKAQRPPLESSRIEGFSPKEPSELEPHWTIIPNFTLNRQQASNWCWISTSLDAHTFYRPDKKGTQCALAGALLFGNEKECCKSSLPAKCDRPGLPSGALQFLKVFASSRPVNNLSYPEVKREIDAGRPIILGYTEQNQSVGHAILVLGYGEENGVGYVYVGDPARGFGTAKFSEVLFTYSKTFSEVSFTTAHGV
jgi:hypothetical protein